MLRRMFRAPLLVEHELTESVTTSGGNRCYHCIISIGAGYKSVVATGMSHHSAAEAKQKAYDELGGIIDMYARVYDQLTAEIKRTATEVS